MKALRMTLDLLTSVGSPQANANQFPKTVMDKQPQPSRALRALWRTPDALVRSAPRRGRTRKAEYCQEGWPDATTTRSGFLQDGLQLDLNRLARRGFIRRGASWGPIGIRWISTYWGEIASGTITANLSGEQEGWFRIQLGNLRSVWFAAGVALAALALGFLILYKFRTGEPWDAHGSTHGNIRVTDGPTTNRWWWCMSFHSLSVATALLSLAAFVVGMIDLRASIIRLGQ
jgi:hypothetical protein